MITIQEEIVVDAPVEDVFALYEDHEKYHHWQPSLVAKKAHDGHLRMGARVTEVHNFIGRKIEIDGSITEYEKNKVLGFTGKGPTLKRLHYENHFAAAEGGKGTRITVVAEFEPTELFGLAKTLIERAARRDVRASLESAKDAIELAEEHAHVRDKAPAHDHHR